MAPATGLGWLTLLPVVQLVVEAIGGLGEALVALVEAPSRSTMLALVEALAEALLVLPEALLALVGALLEAFPETLLLLAEALLAWAWKGAWTEALLLQTLRMGALTEALRGKLLKSEAAHRGCSSP